MSFLTPLFLWLALLAAPIIVLYMLRLRRQEVMVSSTLLWQKLLRDREANAPWQKLRRNLLLLLQLLILAGLVLALARPFLPVASIVNGSVVILLDASASMQATDVSPTRFAAALAEVARLIDDLGGTHQMTLIQVGQTPQLLAAATGDKNLLRQALATATVAPVNPDWPAALALAAGAAQGFRDPRIVIVSDGGLPADLPPLPVEPIFLPVGESGENLALAALATRDTEAGTQLFASVRNEGLVDRSVLLSLTLDGVLFDARQLMVAAQAETAVTWEVPTETAVITAQLSQHSQDYLALDDTAWAVHDGGQQTRALIVTRGNRFLEQIFTVLPGINSFKAAPGSDLTAESFDLYILDGVPLPDPLPEADLLLVNPMVPETAVADTSSPLFTQAGIFSDTVAIRLADSPLLQFVDWSNVHIQQAQALSAPWAETLVQATGGPLLLIGEQNGHRIATLTFDLRQSDLPLQIAFPVLIANITGWLSPGRAFDAPTGLHPGEAITLSPGASTTAVSITKPDGSLWTAQTSADPLIFSDTQQPGIYQVTLSDPSDTRPGGRFAVNLFSPSESNIQPITVLHIGQAEVGTASNTDIGQRELWPWLISLALGLILLEWWIYHRGTTWPKWQNKKRQDKNL